MKKSMIVGLMGGMLSLGVMAQTEISTYVPGLNAEGITYFLPQTVIDIKIEAEKTTYTPGQFCDYANKYLRLQGVSSEADTYWEIKQVDIKTIGIPDTKQGYTIKLKDKSIASFVELSEDGLLLSINNNKTSDKHSPTPQPDKGGKKQTIDPRDILNEEILSATSTAKMAELVAKEIYNIRESKNAILRGQADNMPKDGESLKIMISNLEAQDEALTSMFKGNTQKENRTIAIRLTPGEETDKEVLFRFSKKRGILSASDLSGSPVYYSLENTLVMPAPDEKTAKKSKRPQGVVYTIPGKTLLTIYKGNEILVEEELSVAQLGNTEVLANDLFNKTTDTQIMFDPATGAVLSIKRE